jgi:hypothetical protein
MLLMLVVTDCRELSSVLLLLFIVETVSWRVESVPIMSLIVQIE